MLNYARFQAEMSKPIVPQTWDDGSNETVLKTPYYKFRKFPSLAGFVQERCITLFPPHAGRHPNIVNGLIRVCQEEGYDTFVFELLPATHKTRDVSLADLVYFGKECFNFPSQKKILMGVCQGLWHSILVAEKPVAQFGFAGPVDFHAGDGYIKKSCQQTPMVIPKFIVGLNGGVQPAWVQWWNFTLGNPWAVFIDEPMKLFQYIRKGEEEKINNWHRNRSWYYSPQSLAGSWFVEAIERFFKNNELKEIVDFKSFDWPLFLYAGENDEITPPVQTFAMADLVSSKLVKKHLFQNCGHTATFCKKEPLEKVRKDLKLISGLKGEGYAG